MNITGDFGANVQLERGLFLQTLDSWRSFIHNKQICFKNNAVEFYFEVSDIDEFYQKLQAAHIKFVHELLEQSWGQRVVRFYDSDYHIIEAGEEMPMVVKRFIHGGMTAEQAAKSMDVPAEYIEECLKD